MRQGSSRGRSLSPLGAYVKSNEGGAAQVREALVTSDAFDDLVKRLEEKTQHNSASKGEVDAISDESDVADAGATTAAAAPAAVNEQPGPAAAVAPQGNVGGSAHHSKGAGDTWKENSEKLAALRTTVHEVRRPVHVRVGACCCPCRLFCKDRVYCCMLPPTTSPALENIQISASQPNLGHSQPSFRFCSTKKRQHAWCADLLSSFRWASCPAVCCGPLCTAEPEGARDAGENRRQRQRRRRRPK